MWSLETGFTVVVYLLARMVYISKAADSVFQDPYVSLLAEGIIIIFPLFFSLRVRRTPKHFPVVSSHQQSPAPMLTCPQRRGNSLFPSPTAATPPSGPPWSWAT